MKYTFTDFSDEIYGITFGWQQRDKCTIALYPRKWGGKSLAMCSFSCENEFIVSDEMRSGQENSCLQRQ
jgi:hypothetical protein